MHAWVVPTATEQLWVRRLAGRRMNVGVLFLILAMLLTPAVDGVAKTLAAEHSPMMIAFVRYLAAGLVALAVARGTGRQHRRCRAATGRPDRPHRALDGGDDRADRRPRHGADGQGGRRLLIAPIVSGLLGILVWREPPTAPRLAGSAISFLGAAVLLRPEAGLEPGCLFALLGGALLGSYLAATRGAGTPDRPALHPRRAVAARRRADRALRLRRRPAGADAGSLRRRARRSGPSRRPATS